MKRHRRHPSPLHAVAACARHHVLLLAAGSGLLVATPAALAQSAPATRDAAMQTIVITTSVRKKLETTQDVPATVSVLSGSELEAQGVTDVKGIEYKIPGLVLGNLGFDGALLGLRGASSTRGFTGDESTVAVHLDGIYVPQSAAALGRLFDVARVDTLYGPQGTLYGRNAVSGVIDIVSNAPGPKFGGAGKVTFGSFSGRGVDGFVNLPLSADSGLRVAVSTYKDDGYIENVIAENPVRRVGTDEFGAGRVRYAHNFGADTRLDIIFQASKDSSLSPFQPRYLDSAPNRTLGVNWRQTAIDQPTENDRKDSNFAIKLDATVAGARLRSLTGYTTYELNQKSDRELSVSPGQANAAGLVVLNQDSKALSQELTLSALDPGVFDWRAGVYYTRSKVNETRYGQSLNSSFFGQRDFTDFRLRQDGNAKAIYGSVDWKPVNSVTGTVGLRYNQETKEQSQAGAYGALSFYGPLVSLPAGKLPAPCAGASQVSECSSADKKEFTWTGASGDASIKWQVNKETMGYGRIARGFRSGAIGGYILQDNWFDVNADSGPPNFSPIPGPGNFPLTKLKPEVLDSIELGVKNTLMGGRLSLNAAVFRNNYKDMLFAFTDPVTFRFIDGNIGSSTLDGVDLNAAYVMVEGLRVDASVSYLDGEIKRIDVATSGVAVGNKPILAPRLSTALGVSYRFRLGGGEMTMAGDYNYKDKMYFDLQNTILRPAVELFNFNVAWAAPGGQWRVFAAVNNAFDKKYLARPSNTLGAAPVPVFVGEPRKLRLGAAFNF